MPPHHGPPPPGHQVNGGTHGGVLAPPKTLTQMAAQVNEAAWLQIGKFKHGPELAASANLFSGSVLELMGDLEGAMQAYEQAIRHNNWSVPAMQAISSILRAKDQFGMAIDYLRTILKIDGSNGEVWGSLGKSFRSINLVTQLTSQIQDTAI